MNWAYLVRCRDGTLYAGWTPDLAKRMTAHNTGKGAKYTRGRGPVQLVWARAFASKSEAMMCEAALKRKTKAEKEMLVKSEGVPPDAVDALAGDVL